MGCDKTVFDPQNILVVDYEGGGIGIDTYESRLFIESEDDAETLARAILARLGVEVAAKVKATT